MTGLRGGHDLRDFLTGVKSAPRGNVNCDCLWCDSRKMYVQCDPDSVHPTKHYSNFGAFDCKKCLVKGGLFKLLTKLGKLELLAGRRVDVSEGLKDLFVDDYVLEAVRPVPTVEMPPGFRRVRSDDYLDARRLKSRHYRDYVCGRVEMSMRHRDRVLIGITQDREVKGYMGRLTVDDPERRRYDNSKTNFGLILGGSDEITNLTKEVIVTEGVFDKIAVDAALGLHNRFDRKCVHLNGKSMSDSQLLRLLGFDGLRKVTLALDADAKADVKTLGGSILTLFERVEAVAPLRKDWGESSDDDIRDAFSRAQHIERFARTQVAVNFEKFRV